MNLTFFNVNSLNFHFILHL